jgi:hypothetical protein
MLDRLDDALEPIARMMAGKALWDEMKKNALAASQPKGGERILLDSLAKLLGKDPSIELHIVGHSAGSIFHAPVVRLISSRGTISSGFMQGESGYGLDMASCALWAPACTIKLFKDSYLPAIENGTLKQFALYILSDKAEQDDNCTGIYYKSLLYLVSNAQEEGPRSPGIRFGRDGIPLLGMQNFIDADLQLCDLFRSDKAKLVISPNTEAEGLIGSSSAKRHGDFDDDDKTVKATLIHILNGSSGRAAMSSPENADIRFQRSGSSLRRRRAMIDLQTGAYEASRVLIRAFPGQIGSTTSLSRKRSASMSMVHIY